MKVTLSNSALKEYRRLQASDISRVLGALVKLSMDPPQGDIKKLQGQKDYRVRVGGLRVIFRIEGERIIVSKIARRGQAYKE